MKNPQTTIAPAFLTHIISAIDSVEKIVFLCSLFITLPQNFILDSSQLLQ